MVSVIFLEPFIGQLTEEAETMQSRFDKIIDAWNRKQEINLYTQYIYKSYRAFARMSLTSNPIARIVRINIRWALKMYRLTSSANLIK